MYFSFGAGTELIADVGAMSRTTGTGTGAAKQWALRQCSLPLAGAMYSINGAGAAYTAGAGAAQGT